MSTHYFLQVEDQRKSLEVELNASLLERGSSVPAKVVKSVLERVQTLVVDGGVHCETISQHLSFTLMGATLFGDVFLTWSKASVYIELLMKIAKHACFWSSYGVSHYWKQEFWTYQQLCSELTWLTQELIRQCRQKYESDSVERDFDRYHMRHEPCAEMISMMFHGSLTMATLIGNILTRLVTHPEIQHKVTLNMIVLRYFNVYFFSMTLLVKACLVKFNNNERLPHHGDSKLLCYSRASCVVNKSLSSQPIVFIVKATRLYLLNFLCL